MPSPSRRTFLAAGSAVALTAAEYARSADKPNERLRVAVMGGRIRGKFHLSAFPQQPNTTVTHLIEPDENMLPEAMKVSAKHQKDAPATETDVRKVLENKDVDVLVVAAPDHWHALGAIWAAVTPASTCTCEKPAFRTT